MDYYDGGQTRFTMPLPTPTNNTSFPEPTTNAPFPVNSTLPINSTFPVVDHGNSTGHFTKPPRYHYYASRYSWGWISAAIVVLIMLNIIRFIKHRRRKREGFKRQVVGYKAVSGDEDDNETEIVEGRAEGNWMTRQMRALGAGWRNTMYLRSFPMWLYMPETVADAIWTILYVAVYLFFCLHRTETWFPMRNNNVANQLGVMSFSQLPIILLLVSKNNPISSLTGITYQKLNYIHRASSRVCLLSSWGHALLWTPRVWEKKDFRPYLLCGIAALTGFTMLWLTSFRIVRRLAYEFFIVSHILFSIMYLVGAWFHWRWLGYWVWPALAIWALDRFLRFAKVIYINNFLNPSKFKMLGESKIELLDHDVMRVTLRRENWSWKAGQHAFISAPSVSASPHESHPFSIANIPTENSNEAIFLIRIHSGFTKRLRTALESEVSTNIPLYLEGPYGYPHSLDSYSTVLLIAGGTGVTFTSGHFLQILANSLKGKSAVKKLHLVWHIRHAEDIEWIAPLLNTATEDTGTVNFCIDIYVTKSHSSDEPLPPDGISDRLASIAPHIFPRQWDEARYNPVTPSVESRDEEILLPKPQRMHEQGVGRYGLTSEAAEIVKWKRGRADLRTIVEEDAKGADGSMNVSVCGPVQLLQSAKKAVREVSTMEATREGLTSIDFFEETLGQ
ncbi:ferric reductase transmembrane component 4 [Cryptococcus neoformans c8]|nr:ferric reductase transmembrane component 4 [Cryptococcus neoformans var. grubii AD1-83a]OXG61603.1 ferric reductase transmembrane component 4 [Cryptococcus neoformans var. grubii MW-RSA1955]OXG65175.1 ferric reductase transmembrane component 4 [Cryptococcus neoformans var. grubii c8]OXG66733.1 ferric reductase transmembrane component 4 [Cryptococcus neoformans var. grubii CHC193]OXH12995.1 ferric reductase transmembrane component 4 [Cryptococcus neoformans var. grubii A5-35-17]OXH13898.1 fe